jgi:hypothetical protein
MLVVTIDGACLTCGSFSLDKTIRFGSLEFIIDYFGSLSLSPKEGDSGAIFVGTTHSGSPSLWDMIEDSLDDSTRLLEEMGASASPSPGDSAQGHHQLPLRSHNDQKTLQPLRP